MSSASAPALAHRAHSRPFLPPARPGACGLHARPWVAGLPRRRVVRGDRPAWQGGRPPQQAPLCPPKASKSAAVLLHTRARPDGPGVVRLRLKGSPPACAERANVGAHCLPDAAPRRPSAPSAAGSTASPRGRRQGGGGLLQAQRGLGGGSSWRVLVCGRGWSPSFWVTGARPGQSRRRHPPATASVDGRVLGRRPLAEHQRAGWRPLPQVLGTGEFTAHHPPAPPSVLLGDQTTGRQWRERGACAGGPDEGLQGLGTCAGNVGLSAFKVFLVRWMLISFRSGRCCRSPGKECVGLWPRISLLVVFNLAE